MKYRLYRTARLCTPLLALALLTSCSDADDGPAQGNNNGGGAAPGSNPGSGGGPGVGNGEGNGNGNGNGPGNGSGATPGVGGAVSGSGGSGTTTGGSSSTDDKTEVDCSINVTDSVSSSIGTVGIVEFSTDLSAVDGAVIQFGPSENYTAEAPVDLAEPNYRTLLLGMTQNSTYHYRVAVTSGTTVCYSDNQTIETGFLPNGGPSNVTPQPGQSSAPAADGFIVTSSGFGGGLWVFIINQDGQLVWAYNVPGGGGVGMPGGFSGITSARISWDGKYMYARDLGPFNAGSGGTIHRIAMDGSSATTLPLSGGHHHDFTVTPQGIAYIAKANAGGCDHIYTANADGSNSQSLVDLWEVLQYFPDTGPSQEQCHVNAIEYYSDGDYFTASDREKDVIVKVSSTGQVLASYGKAPTMSLPNHALAEGAGTTWRVQHGHHLYEDNKLVLFSNGPIQGGTSRLLHYTINGSEAKLDWQYSEMGNSATLGDAQALHNGNFLVVASNNGNIDEVDSNAQRVRRYAISGGTGYAIHRKSLYGPPPPR